MQLSDCSFEKAEFLILGQLQGKLDLKDLPEQFSSEVSRVFEKTFHFYTPEVLNSGMYKLIQSAVPHKKNADFPGSPDLVLS